MDRDRKHGGIGRVAVQGTDPAAEPNLLRDASHRGVRLPDPVEDEEIEAGDEQHDEKEHDERAAVIQRVEAGGVEPVHESIGPRYEAPAERSQPGRYAPHDVLSIILHSHALPIFRPLFIIFS